MNIIPQLSYPIRYTNIQINWYMYVRTTNMQCSDHWINKLNLQLGVLPCMQRPSGCVSGQTLLYILWHLHGSEIVEILFRKERNFASLVSGKIIADHTPTFNCPMLESLFLWPC